MIDWVSVKERLESIRYKIAQCVCDDDHFCDEAIDEINKWLAEINLPSPEECETCAGCDYEDCKQPSESETGEFMDDFLAKLAERLQVFGADIISADEIADWPTGKLEELVEAGVLEEIQHSKGVVCGECEENCFIEPDIRTNSDTGVAAGVFVCTRNPDIGRIEVDLDRLKQWKISGEKLEALGYGKEKTKKRNKKISSDLTKKEYAILKKLKEALTRLEAMEKENASLKAEMGMLKMGFKPEGSVDIKKLQADLSKCYEAIREILERHVLQLDDSPLPEYNTETMEIVARKIGQQKLDEILKEQEKTNESR